MVRRLLLVLAALLPGLSSGQAGDPRFSKSVTLHQSYITLSEFGHFVAENSSVKINVAKPISERKVTIFCEDKPLGEIMAKVASTLFLEWSPEKDGLRLILNKDVDREEQQIIAERDRQVQAALRAEIEDLIDISKKSSNELKAEMDAVQTEIGQLNADKTQDNSEKISRDYQRWNTLTQWSNFHLAHTAGYVLDRLSDQEISGLEAGGTVMASTANFRGILQLPASSEDDFPNFVQDKGNAAILLLGLSVDPDTQTFRIKARGGSSATEMPIDLTNGMAAATAIRKQDLITRIKAWAKNLDPSVRAATLNQNPNVPEGDPDDCWTLADNLEWLHDQTRIPIVADAYRIFASYRAPIHAKTLGDWISGAVAPQTEAERQRYAGPQRVMDRWLSLRTENGWLMGKDRDYWQRLDTEVPESLIRPVEAAIVAKHELWTEDYAAFANKITNRQAAALPNLIAHFPVLPLIGNVDLLRLWNDIGSNGRAQATHGGYAVASMSPEEVATYIDLLRAHALFGVMDQKLIANFLPGGPPLPNDMALLYKDSRQAGVELNGSLGKLHMNYEMNKSYSSGFGHPLHAALFSFGIPNGPQENFQVSFSDPTPSG